MNALHLVAEHGSPLWLADVDRVRENAERFREAWRDWPDACFAYSYKTNRTPPFLTALAEAGYLPEVVCEAELRLAQELATDAAGAIVNGPAKSPALLRRAALADALVIADSAGELDRLAAAGVTRAGLRIAMEGVGEGPTRFGIPASELPAAAARAAALGLEVEALGVHRVSIGFAGPLRPDGGLAARIVSTWPQPPGLHAEAAAVLAQLALRMGIRTIDLGGGYPAGTGLDRCAAEVIGVLRAAGFDGRLLLEPGRALVGDAVDLVVSVAAVKRLAGGERCVIVDGGTNLVPGALWRWPAIEPLGSAHPERSPALVTGPLCLNVDVLHPAAELPPLRPGDLLAVRAVGAYQQSQSTQFGDLRPAVVAREGGVWRLAVRRERVGDLIAGVVGEAKEVR